MSGDWYYLSKCRGYGPFESYQIHRLLEGDVISAECLVWREGDSESIPALVVSKNEKKKLEFAALSENTKDTRTLLRFYLIVGLIAWGAAISLAWLHWSDYLLHYAIDQIPEVLNGKS